MGESHELKFQLRIRTLVGDDDLIFIKYDYGN